MGGRLNSAPLAGRSPSPAAVDQFEEFVAETCGFPPIATGASGAHDRHRRRVAGEVLPRSRQLGGGDVNGAPRERA